MTPWRKSMTGQPKKWKSINKPTTFTATKSASRVRWPMMKLIWFGSVTIPARVVWKRTGGFIRMRISRLDCRTNTSMKRLGCTITRYAITSLMRVGLWIRSRLDCGEGRIYMLLRRIRRSSLIRSDYLMLQVPVIIHVIIIP